MKKLTAIAVSMALTLTLCSCEVPFKRLSEGDESEIRSHLGSTSEPSSGTASQTDYSYCNIDLETVNEHIEQLLDDLKISDNRPRVTADIRELLNDLDLLNDRQAYLMVDSYADWDNEELEIESDQAQEDEYVAFDAICYAFSKGAKSKEYGDLFTELVNADTIDYFTSSGMSLARAEGYAQVDFRVGDENVDEYYEIAYNDELSDDEKDLRCAEVYLKILQNIDIDTYYSSYNRDYTPQEILALSKTVREEFVPLSDELSDAFFTDKHADDVLTKPALVTPVFEKILEYSGRILPEIQASAQVLNDEELYRITTDNCYYGAFTSDLPYIDRAIIYVYSDGSYYDFDSAVHEFGHFHAALQDSTSTFETQSNLDVAEVQSQGMQVLFMQFADELYGDQAEAMKLLQLSDLADAVVDGFLVGEFEYTALMKRDELTPEQVVELYSEIMGDRANMLPFYYVSHMYENPGYYISYGVSALAALELVDDALNAPEKAAEKYEKIAEIPPNDKNTKFRGSLEKCGFEDVLTESFIGKTADRLREFC